MPIFRITSPTGVPVSACRSAKAICSSLYRVFFIRQPSLQAAHFAGFSLSSLGPVFGEDLTTIRILSLRKLRSWWSGAKPVLQRLKPRCYFCVYVVAKATTSKDSRVLTGPLKLPATLQPLPELQGGGRGENP